MTKKHAKFPSRQRVHERATILHVGFFHKELNSKVDTFINSKTCVKLPFSKICFQDQLLLNACQKYCRMLQGGHSVILLTFVKLPFVDLTYFMVYKQRDWTQAITKIENPLPICH